MMRVGSYLAVSVIKCHQWLLLDCSSLNGASYWPYEHGYVLHVRFPGVTSQTSAHNPCLMLIAQTVTD